MTTTEVTPKVWIGCLAAYNEGHLHGEWVDADDGAEALWEAKDRIIESSPALLPEEWFIADYEGFPRGSVGEYTSLDTVAELAEKLAEVSFVPAEAVTVWIEHDPSDALERLEYVEEAYCGEWDSGGAYAEDFYESTGQITDDTPLRYYIDWDAVWRDEFAMAGYFIEDGYIFNTQV